MAKPHGEIRTCPVCGKEFKKIRFRQRTCGDPGCAKAYRQGGWYVKKERPQVACTECGAMFAPKTSQQVTCSAECRKARRRRMQSEAHQARARGYAQKRCIVCGKMFVPGSPGQSTCGDPQCRSMLAARTYKAVHGKRSAVPIVNDRGFYDEMGFTPGCKGPYDINFCPLG